jgi:hypothetical protein
MAVMGADASKSPPLTAQERTVARQVKSVANEAFGSDAQSLKVTPEAKSVAMEEKSVTTEACSSDAQTLKSGEGSEIGGEGSVPL